MARPLRDTLPLPKDLITDPVIVIQSLLVTTGVLVFIPFPSALFNSTLEANYASTGLGAIDPWLPAPPDATTSWGAVRTRRCSVECPCGVCRCTARGRASARSRGARLEHDSGNRSLWVTPIGVVAFVLLTALLACLAGSDLGPDMQSLATLAGITAGLAVVLAISQIPAVLAYRQHGIAFHFEALPGAAVIGVGCVLVGPVDPGTGQPSYTG